jgi:hypothetical protein
LFGQVRDRIRVKHYSLRTEDAYLHWIRSFIFFHGKKHPRETGGPQVEAFLSHLATVGRVPASTQNQASSALLFLYREVLQVELPWMDGVVRAKRPQRVPVVLTENEVRAHLARVRALHERDLAEGFGEVHLPFALARKYPKPGRSWFRQYAFPSAASAEANQSALIFAVRTTLLHRSCSFLMNAAYSAGVEPTGPASSAARRSSMSGLFAAFAASAARRWMIASGVFAGAFRPYHCEVSKPG